MLDNESIQPSSPIEPHRYAAEETTSKPSNFQTKQNPDDPWVKMFAPYGASTEDIEKFKEGIMRTVNDQMNHDNKRMLQALQRLKKGED